MNDMTPAKATALRKPFPPESVGQLPKGGVMLDYVGHAAVTDRLLTVDPEWSWEFALHRADGTPVLDDGSGNLWIALTICGVTRKGVGDGKNAKERIGDAIRNAAMRFGVALDLWAKENLVEFAQQQRGPAPPARPTIPALAPGVSTVPAPTPSEVAEQIVAETGLGQDADYTPPPMAAKTRAAMFAEFGRKGIAEDQQLAGINTITGKTYTSRGDLTDADAKMVIAALKKRPDVAAEQAAS